MRDADCHPNPTDEQLAKRLQQDTDDLEAQRLLVARYSRLLLAHIRKWVFHPQDAEEVLMEAFHQIIRRIDTYRSAKAPFSAWCHAIAENKAIDQARRQRASRKRCEVVYLEDLRRNQVPAWEGSESEFEVPETYTDDSAPLNDESDSDSEDEVLVTQLECFAEQEPPMISPVVTQISQWLKSELSERQRLLIRLRWEQNLEWDELAAELVPLHYPSKGAMQADHTRILQRLKQTLRS